MSNEGIAAPTAQEPVDRRAVLLEQFNEVEAAQSKTATEAPEPRPSSERIRDEAGKFAPKDKAPVVVSTAPVVEAAPVDPPVWDRPPASWKKDFHPLWASADPKLREYAYQREEQMRAGVEPLLPKAQLADQISKVAEPYMNTIRGMGLELPAAVEGLMKVDHELRTLPPEQKVQRLLGLAQYYGISLNGAQQQQPVTDPNFFAVQNELLGLKGELANWKQQQEEMANRNVLNEINNFARGKEHFEIARPFMVDLLHKSVEEGGVTSLDEAYEKVTGPGGVLHDLIAASAQAAAIPNQRAQADKAAKAARAAAVSVRSSTPGNLTTTKAQDRRSMLREQFDSVNDRL